MSKKAIVGVGLLLMCVCSMSSSSSAAFFAMSPGVEDPVAPGGDTGGTTATAASGPTLPVGRFVRITQTVAYDANATGNVDDKNKIINVAELEVFDENDKLISSNTPVTGSSEYSATHGFKNLTDGNMTNFAHTKGRTQGEIDYMQLDLGTDKKVKKIVVTNRTSCCKSRIKGVKIMVIASDQSTKGETPVITGENDKYTYDFTSNSGWA